MNVANTFPTLLEAFFMDRLVRQRQVSPHTLASYRDTFRLLLQYAQRQLGRAPSAVTLPDLDTPFLGAFLDHLEQERDNSARSRNVRLAAIHSFFRYVALHTPEHSALAQRALAMPSKRYPRRPIDFLTPAEVAALLAAPTSPPGAGVAIGHCCCLPCRPDYALPNCSACAVRTSCSAPAPTCNAKAKGAKSATRHCARRLPQCCAVGCESVKASLQNLPFRPPPAGR